MTFSFLFHALMIKYLTYFCLGPSSFSSNADNNNP